MSYDFALARPCQHQVLFEIAQRDPTKEFIFFQKPPAGQSVNLYINGTFVPKEGLFSFAEIAFTKSEPYRIIAGQSDLLYIGIGSGIPRFIQLLTGSQVSAADLAHDLSLKLPDLSISVRKKHVILRSRTPFNGPAFIFPDPRWTDRTSSSPFTVRSLGGCQQLGVSPGRVASGSMIYPGYDIVQNPNAPGIPQFKVMRLRGSVPNQNPLIQLSYVTLPDDCRRCNGSRIEFDYGVVGGTYEQIQDTDLLSQEFDKFLFTKLGSHWKWTWLGSNLIDRIGGKGNTARSAVGALISLDISQAFKVYQNVKSQQAQRAPQQKVSDAEFPSSLDNIDVKLDPNDPTIAIVTTTIRSKSRTPVPLRRIIGNPNPFNLSGDSGFNISTANDQSFRLRG